VVAAFAPSDRAAGELTDNKFVFERGYPGDKGKWSESDNWDLREVPTEAHAADIGYDKDGPVYVCWIDPQAEDSKAGQVYLGKAANEEGILLIEASLEVGNEAGDGEVWVGFGTGSVGELTMSADLTIGHDPGLPDPFVPGDLWVGYGVDSAGTFTKESGYLHCGSIQIAYQEDAAGTFTHIAGDTHCGDITLAHGAQEGNPPSGAGTFYLQGGEVRAKGNVIVGQSGKGHSLFEQTGGTLRIIEDGEERFLEIGSIDRTIRGAGGFGTYRMTGGILDVPEIVLSYNSGKGTFIQDGEDTTAQAGVVRLWVTSDQYKQYATKYELSAGQLTVSELLDIGGGGRRMAG